MIRQGVLLTCTCSPIQQISPEARFVDAGWMQPRHQQHGLTGYPRRCIDTNACRCVPDRHVYKPLGYADGIEISEFPDESV